ncbi:hypothetical protein [Vibrio harveyi]|uniref:hypothetical protein n=1 Tax=Vibrio harveyi TaxID=669 RepID=UPI003BB58D3D
MLDTDTPFERALISSIEIDNPRKLEKQVKEGVIKRCLERGLLSEEDKRVKSKIYQWVYKVIDNDFSALVLLRKEKTKITTSSDLKELFYDIDDICEEVILRIATRILDRKLEL